MPEPAGTSCCERLGLLPDFTAFAEPVHSQMSVDPAPPSLLDPISVDPPIPSDQVSVGSVATPPPSYLDPGALPMLQPVSPDRVEPLAEIPTQRPVISGRDSVDRTHIQRPRRRRRRGVRFSRDEIIEFTDNELRWNEDNAVEMEEFTVSRPHVVWTSVLCDLFISIFFVFQRPIRM